MVVPNNASALEYSILAWAMALPESGRSERGTFCAIEKVGINERIGNVFTIGDKLTLKKDSRGIIRI